MRAELWNAAGFVAAFTMPPFKAAPTRVDWDGFGYDRADAPAVHTERCGFLNAKNKDTTACACDGGAFAYLEAGGTTAKKPAHQLMDMHKVTDPRDKILTTKPKAPKK